MNLRQIEAFRAVMQSGTTARAAVAIHTSQPAVSRLVAQLEASLRMRLFERERSRLRPTPEARLLLKEVEVAFIGLDRIAERAEWIRSGTGGSLTVGCLPALGFGAMPKIVSLFLKRFPGVSLKLDILASREVRESVASGRCDVGFAADEIDTGGLAATAIGTQRGLVVMAQDHSLASRRSISMKQIAGYPFIALSVGDSARRQLDAKLAAHHQTLNIRVETPYSLTVAALAREGVGIGVVNPMALSQIDREGLVCSPWRSPSCSRH